MRSEVLLRGTAALICIGFAVWVVFAWTHYGDRYAMATEGWRIGGTHWVELTVVVEDRDRLACSSDVKLGEVGCAFDGAGRPQQVSDENLLSPFNTNKNQLFLGAGLWSELSRRGQLPPGRFSVVCNFHVLGAMRPSLRWQLNERFAPLKESIAAGTLRECEIPR